MKKGILFLLIAFAVTANAQSLKDALYSGKLKNDSNSVVRKTDDLSTKIDTARKKPVEPEKTKLIPVVSNDSSAKKTSLSSDSAGVVSSEVKDNNTVIKDNNAVIKDNNKIWKEYMDSLAGTLKTEVLTSKKIKDGTYYLFVEYEIAPDGQVSITNVISSPENSYLQEQAKERLILTAPQKLNPVLSSAGKPIKVKRRYNFNVTKG